MTIFSAQQPICPPQCLPADLDPRIHHTQGDLGKQPERTIFVHGLLLLG